MTMYRNTIGNESLENWTQIGSGGFGSVYKAKHKDWRFDVAIKILQQDSCSSLDNLFLSHPLLREADKMDKASSPHVLRYYGVFQGCPPHMGSRKRLGIVMEMMKGGSLQSLQTSLCGPPPMPLAFRLAHQVALGMNFLHSLTPPLVHHDLKPANVLLDADLNAKICDFGLSRVSSSVSMASMNASAENGGTVAYMPPEAFNVSYKPARAYDLYSYGVLLWSIFTGKEPYPDAIASIVALRIPLGDRPNCSEITMCRSDGVRELVDLMKRCWDNDPDQRPPFGDCVTVTEHVVSRHAKTIRDAVNEVLSKPKMLTFEVAQNYSPSSSASGLTSFHSAMSSVYSNVKDDNILKINEASSQKDVVNMPRKLTDAEKETFVDEHKADLIQDVSAVMAILDDLGDMVHPETYARTEAKETSQEKMRFIYMHSLRSGGKKVKAAFYNALKQHEPHLVERLGDLSN